MLVPGVAVVEAGCRTRVAVAVVEAGCRTRVAVAVVEACRLV